MTAVMVCFDDAERPYHGPELRSHFARHTFGVDGDALVAWVGPCRVDLPEMVDLEDVRNEEPIFSPRMLHFFGEHFEIELREMVYRQRLLVRLAADALGERANVRPQVRGDDLFIADRKASVSIATRTPVSCVLHLGINIETEGTPIPTWGLAEAGVDARDFGRQVLTAYRDEVANVHAAVAKVRGVP